MCDNTDHPHFLQWYCMKKGEHTTAVTVRATAWATFTPDGHLGDPDAPVVGPVFHP